MLHWPLLFLPHSDNDIDPNKSNGTVFGDCSFGPVINLVMLQIEPDEVRPPSPLGRAVVGECAATAAAAPAAATHLIHPMVGEQCCCRCCPCRCNLCACVTLCTGAVPSLPPDCRPGVQVESMCPTW